MSPHAKASKVCKVCGMQSSSSLSDNYDVPIVKFATISSMHKNVVAAPHAGLR